MPITDNNIANMTSEKTLTSVCLSGLVNYVTIKPYDNFIEFVKYISLCRICFNQIFIINIFFVCCIYLNAKLKIFSFVFKVNSYFINFQSPFNSIEYDILPFGNILNLFSIRGLSIVTASGFSSDGGEKYEVSESVTYYHPVSLSVTKV